VLSSLQRMQPDPTGPILAALTAGGTVVLLFIAIEIAVVGLTIWITYTIIWRAVPRGLREFHYPGIPIKNLSAGSVPRQSSQPRQ